jgi:hypothetical protein
LHPPRIIADRNEHTGSYDSEGYRTGLYHIGLKVGDTFEELKTAEQDLEKQCLSGS